MKRLLESDAVDDLSDDVVLALFDVSYPLRETDATQFRALSRWRRFSERYKRLIDELVYPSMRALPRVFGAVVNNEVLLRFPALRHLALAGNKGRVSEPVLIRCTALERLELADDFVIPGARLTALSQLTELRLVGRSALCVHLRAHLPGSLRHLELIEHRESNSHHLVSRLTQLDTLVYSEHERGQLARRRPVHDTFWPHSITGLTNLTALTIACDTWGEWPLAQLTGLQSLILDDYAKVNAEELIALPHLTRLQMAYGYDRAPVIRQLTGLVSLQLNNNDYNQIRITDLQGLTRLRELVLIGTASVFTFGLRGLEEEAELARRLPQLRIVRKEYDGRVLTK